MSNVIASGRLAPGEEALSMSNQGTDCFLELLLAAASEIEATARQRALLAFLAERREINALAPGSASFDLEEMPWEPDSLGEDTRFLLDVIERAKDPRVWAGLGYEPEERIVFPWLDRFAELVEGISE